MIAKRWAGVVLLGLIFLIAVSGQAQDEPDSFRLRIPTSTEYLEALPETLETWREEMPPEYGKVSALPVFGALWDDAEKRYEDILIGQPFDVLNNALSEVLTSPPNSHYRFNVGSEWTMLLLEAWLRENPVDLSLMDKLEFPRFSFTFEAVDFDGDGSDEFAGKFSSYSSGYLALQRDGTRPEGYRIAYQYHQGIQSSEAYNVYFQPLQFEDITGDGQPEWFFADETNYSGVWYSCGSLIILSWVGDTLVNIAPEDATGWCEVSYLESALEKVNLDDDAAMELRVVRRDQDNWQCDRQTTAILDWDGTSYQLISSEQIMADTLGCAMRQSEPLLWAGAWSEAIPLLEHGLSVGQGELESYQLEIVAEIEQYAQLRLTLAYSMSGRDGDAAALIDILQDETPASVLTGELIDVMAAESDAVSRCIALYNVLNRYERSYFSSLRDFSHILMGRIEYFSGMAEDSPPQADKAGCDAPTLIDDLLELPFSTGGSPIEQLEERGLTVDESIRADLNGDGQDEWLVWLEARVSPLLFVVHEETYLISRPNVRRPSDYAIIEPQTMELDGERLLIDWIYISRAEDQNFRMAYFYDMSTSRCVNPLAETQINFAWGNVRLWRLRAGALEQIVEAPLCEPGEIADLFSPDGSEFYAWALVRRGAYPAEDYYDTGTYQWDDQQRDYLPPPLPESDTTSSAQPLEPISMTDAYVFEAILAAREQFIADDYAGALVTLEDALERHDPVVAQPMLDAARFWRALVLEHLGREDEALETYVTLVREAAGTTWGQLAAMHIEPVS